ncbi:coilin isoform X2 [Macadamia integrifolia]|uniref:coilin isoform X2 n=1 Tax=Macadamia integrifolia TaxID=60698 RepID=UPI001C4EEE9F|nr:coilin isoform X2 [Macadamia integrifolia]
MEAVRLRLLFNDRHLLGNSLKLEGLKRSWLLLRPELETISDLASHVAKTFQLEEACPNGLVLSMDGFVLPSFESTRILKDKDIIRVKRKGVSLTDVIRVSDDANSVEDSEIMEKQLILTGAKPLGIEFERETGDSQSENEGHEYDGDVYPLPVENISGGKTTSKKRKPSKEHTNPKRKKAKSTRSEKCPLIPEAVENDVCKEQNGSLHPKEVLTKKRIYKKDKLSNVNAKSSRECPSKVTEEVHKTGESTPDEDRCGQPQESGTENFDISDAANGTKKFPSRSARRKKAKRQWLREVKSQEREEQRETGQITQSHTLEEVNQEELTEHQQRYQNTDGEDEIVPIVVRPGHIRFEPIGEGQVAQQNKDEHIWDSWEDQLNCRVLKWLEDAFSGHLQETFKWNGTTSKKRGQKWGTEKTLSSRKRDDKGFNQHSTEKLTMEEGEQTLSCRKKDDMGFNQDSTEKLTIEEGELVHHSIDFESLAPFSSPPKEGDVIAYRLVELSSSWCPELSSFRVGKVSWYDSLSNKVMLVPVPGHPIGERLDEVEDEDASGMQPDSLYGEDGSLEIDFVSLVDTRVIHHGNSNPAAGVNAGSDVHMSDHKAVRGVAPSGNTGDKDTPVTGNGEQKNVWEELSQALCQKKTQLSQNGYTKNESSGRSAWSFKALRSSALGPTMALLRAQNEM